ncbi:MAG: hypothetical protein WC375_10915 [Methanomassiliicoccales archaeon]|jgi:hypothetical protein
MTIKPLPDIFIYVSTSPDKVLRDTRPNFRGQVFGTVGDVAKQYGIAMEPLGIVFRFSAPKNRMQMFVERLHFAGVKFSEDAPK